MSILFDAVTEKHSIAADATIDSLDAMTIILWYKASSVASFAHVALTKDTAAETEGFSLFRPKFNNGPNDWQFIRTRATTGSNIQTTGNIVQAGRWEFLAVSDDTSAAPSMVHGTLAARPTSPSLYAAATKGVGLVVDDSVNPLIVGVGAFSNQSANLNLGFLGIWNRRMTVAQMLSHWPRPRCDSGCVLFSFPGLHGSTSLVDLSGNRNNGTLFGSPTWSAPPPLPHGLLGPRRGRVSFQSVSSISRRVSLGETFVGSGRTVLIG